MTEAEPHMWVHGLLLSWDHSSFRPTLLSGFAQPLSSLASHQVPRSSSTYISQDPLADPSGLCGHWTCPSEGRWSCCPSCLWISHGVNSQQGQQLADALGSSGISVNPKDCERPEANFRQVTAGRVVTSVCIGMKTMQV